MTGTVLKGVGGAYTVLSGGKRHTLRARGTLRLGSLAPVAGDRVEFEPARGGGWLTRILPRANELGRPPVANLELAAIVLACESPSPDLLLADKLLLCARRAGIPAAVIVNKLDIGREASAGIAAEYERSGARAFAVSAATGEGIEALREALSGRVFALCGQSGVGKSSILNALYGLRLASGELSARIGRGKHTTRACEFIPVEGGGMAADTPGFSLIEMGLTRPDAIRGWMGEFAPYEGECRFSPCSHRSEPDCAVREAAERGAFPFGRWTRYCVAYDEAEAKWRKRYG